MPRAVGAGADLDRAEMPPGARVGAAARRLIVALLWRKAKPARKAWTLSRLRAISPCASVMRKQLKRAFELAESHSRAKSRFLANMSHELQHAAQLGHRLF